MATRPTGVDTIIRRAYTVTFDDEGTVLQSGAIAVDDGQIVAVGDSDDIEATYTAKQIIDGQGLLAMPGLIDAHLHTAQTMMKGLFPELVQKGRLRQPIWRQYLIPFESHLSDEDMALSADLAAAAMLQHGTTTFFDAGGPHPQAAAAAYTASGIRGVVTRSTVDNSFDIPESMQLTFDDAVQENIDLVEAWPDDGRRVTGAMALRQIMNCSPELITAIHSAAQERGVKVHTHLLEGMDEIDYSIQRYGCRPLQFLEGLGVFDGTLHCAHSVYATPWDVEEFRKNGVSVAHCGNNYNFGVPRALEYWRAGVPLGLGTDGAATSQGTLDMFRIAAIVGAGQQQIYGVPVHESWVMDPDEALRMATRGGAAALGMSDRIGQLEAGAKADIVLLRLDGTDAAVSVTPFAFLVDGATGHDVDTVLVDGETVVRGGEVLTLDVAEIRATGAVRQRELVAALGE
jgi:5-methylthioadenosine/S-adenosylhomocysteine deaminase